MGRINCFIPFATAEQAAQTIENLKKNALVAKICLLATSEDVTAGIDGCELLHVKGLTASDDTVEQSNEEGIPFLSTDMQTYETVGKIYQLLNA